MYVIKRSGKKEEVKMDKILARITKLSYGLDSTYVSPVEVAMKVVQGLYEGVPTTQLDNLAAETAAALTTKHPDYAVLAARIAVSNLHKNTEKSFSNTIDKLYKYVDPITNDPAPLIAEDVHKIVMDNADRLDSTLIYDRDYGYDFFGFKTMERSYLLKMNGNIVERPQHMLMRVAVGIHMEDIDSFNKQYYF